METLMQSENTTVIKTNGRKGPALIVHHYTPEQETRFLDLIKTKGRLIHSIMNKYSFIVESNREDYYQEIVCTAWKNFHSYSPLYCSFVTWLYRNAEWAILAFRRQTRRHYDGVGYHEDFADFEIPDIEDTYFEDYEALNRAISDLPKSLRRAVQIFLQGEGRSLGKAAVNDGKATTYYATSLYKARQIILKKRNKYFDDVKVDPAKFQKREMKGGMVHEGRPVEMRGMDGSFIKSYPSTQAVALDGFSQANVTSCCNGKRVSHKAFRWNYVGDFRPELHLRSRGAGFIKTARPVDQISMTGEILKSWPSAKAAADEGGFNAHCIRHVINGKYKEHKGYIWKLSNTPING